MPSDIPRGLMRVIVRCLQKDPRRRYADVAELAVALEEFASAPGAAARIRAVLDTRRTELDPADSVLLADPDAETKTAASIDTTQRVQRRGLRGRLGRWPSLLVACAVMVCAVALAFAAKGPPPSPPSTSPGPMAAPAPAAIAPASTAASPSAAPPTSVPPPSASKPGPTRGAPARRASSSSPAAATTAPPRSTAPVLVPKTTEF
jgi:hypothetical protein